MPTGEAAGIDAAYGKAVELLARRPHFAAEVRRKLAARGFAPEAVAGALERLAERGYLDDRAAAHAWVESARRRGYGPRRLRAELASRGVAEEIAREAVAAAFGAGELEAALAAAAHLRGRDPAALARALDRKGFSKAVILEILDRLGAGAGDETE